MAKLRLICIGFEPFYEFDDDVETVLFLDRLPKDIELREIIFAIKRIAKNADAILVNTGLHKDELSVEEALFIQIAYTISTPIFGVGKVDGNQFLTDVVLNRFDSFVEALDHIRANYRGL
jgi:hypothetical protein